MVLEFPRYPPKAAEEGARRYAGTRGYSMNNTVVAPLPEFNIDTLISSDSRQMTFAVLFGIQMGCCRSPYNSPYAKPNFTSDKEYLRAAPI